jgi:3-oxosteroid 1-dehydrogenase
LQTTVARFNEFARTGVDEDFHRRQKRWFVDSPRRHGNPQNRSLGSIEKAPFCGLRLHPSASASAGLLANHHAQVIHQRHRPIPGLYAVDNAAAQTEYGVGYQAGHSLTSGMTFGYLAAMHMRDRQN